MTKSLLAKLTTAAAVALTLSVQSVASAATVTNETIFTAVQKGITYLGTNQASDGSVVGFSDVSDWAVLAVAANGQAQATFENNGVSALDYLRANPLNATSLATDVEKRILAIVAAKEATTNFGGVDYNALLSGYHNNNQIGDPTLLNDDMFGLIAVAALDDPTMLAMAQDALDYLTAHQDVSGGFSYTTDTCVYCGPDSNDTAAAIIALKAAEALGLTNADLASAQTAAVAYLLATQQADGGFGYDQFSPSDGSSTAWALMALNALGDDVTAEATAAIDWLLGNQNTDGGFSYGAYDYTDSDVYTTAHAVMAILGTTWLLQPEPIVRPAVTPPAPTASIIQVSSPPQVNNQNPTPDNDATPEQEVLSSTTTTPSEQARPTVQPIEESPTPEPAKTNSTSPWVFWGAIILGLVAVSWFVLQSKSKQKD